MIELEDFLEFILENIDDKRIEFYKKMKFGHRHFYININLKSFEKNLLPNNQTFRGSEMKTLSIIIDCRNNCIEFGEWENQMIFEDSSLTEKWSNKFEKIYSEKLSEKFNNKIYKFFSEVDPTDRDLPRSWKMRDWFNETTQDSPKRDSPPPPPPPPPDRMLREGKEPPKPKMI
jgi:hypothetical protein